MILAATFKAATASLLVSTAQHLPERAIQHAEQALEGVLSANVIEDLRVASGDLQRLVKSPSRSRPRQGTGMALQGRGASPLVPHNLMAGLPAWLAPVGVLGIAAILFYRFEISSRMKNPFDNRTQKLQHLADEIRAMIDSNKRPGEIVRKRLLWAELMVSSGLTGDPGLKLQVVICEQYFRNGGSGRGRNYSKELERVAQIKKTLGISADIARSLIPRAKRELLEGWIRYYQNRPDQSERTRTKLEMYRNELVGLPQPALQEVD